jgi:MFS family permease
MWAGLRARLGVFSTILRSPVLRRVELAFAVFNIGEWATWIAILVYAYQRGGPIEVGLISFLQLLPATVVAPGASVLADRIPRLTVLRASYVAQGLTMAAAAIALGSGTSSVIVYAFAIAAATAVTLTRPAQQALLPSIAQSPEELTAGNVATGTIENAGVFAGPAVAGLILGLAGPAEVFGVIAVALLASAVLLARIQLVHVPPSPSHDHARAAEYHPELEEEGDHSLRAAFGGGFRALRHDRSARLVVALLACSQILLGALDVFYVVLAIGLFGLGESGVGLLNGALGIGGLLGSAAAIALVGRRWLSGAFVAGLVLFGLAIAAIGFLPVALVAVAALLLAGAGRSFADVAAWTILQRVVPDAVLARIFGILEGVNMGAQGAGAVIASLLVAAFGGPVALAVLGLALGAVSVLRLAAVGGAERATTIPERELQILRGVPMFAPLRPDVIERLAGRAVHVAFPDGSVIIREGDPGDRWFVIVHGGVEVTIAGRHVRAQGPGDSFGEIALMRDVPRTATVTAIGPVELLALDRDPFLAAVGGVRASLAAAGRLIDERLAAGAAVAERTGDPGDAGDGGDP